MSDTFDDAEQHEDIPEALDVDDLDVPDTDAQALSGGQKIVLQDEGKGQA